MRRKFLPLALVLALCLGLCTTAMAESQAVSLEVHWEFPDNGVPLFYVRETDAAGEFRLESEGLEAAGTFINLDGWDTAFPVYKSASPVTVTLTGGCTKEEMMSWGVDEEGNTIVEGNAVLTINEVTYDPQSREITLVKENAAYFDGTVYDFQDGSEITIEAYQSNPDAIPNGWGSVVTGAAVTLSQPGIYHIQTYWHWTAGSCEVVIIVGDGDEDGNATPAAPAVTGENTPAGGTAYASAQTVAVDGKSVEFQMYALKDADGNSTNYIKLRDLASVLNGTAAQFEVGWDGAVNILAGQSYTPNGSEMSTPFSGDRSYELSSSETLVNGLAVSLEAIVLKDDAGDGYTYYKLRDLGEALGFNVSWSAELGVFIETDKPYSGQ